MKFSIAHLNPFVDQIILILYWNLSKVDEGCGIHRGGVSKGQKQSYVVAVDQKKDGDDGFEIIEEFIVDKQSPKRRA